MAQQQFYEGQEFENPNDPSAPVLVWSKKGGFVRKDQYESQRAEAASNPQAEFDGARETLKLLSDARGKVGILSTGQLGRLGAGEKTDQGRKGGWGGSPGYELEEAFMPLRARIKLMEAAAAKSRGVSLAPMSNSDAKSLESTLGSLDVGRSAGSIRTVLDDVRSMTLRRQKGLDASNPYDLAQDKAPAIPQGALFRGPDGKLYTNTRGAGWPAGRAPQSPQQKRQARPAASGWSIEKVG